MAQRTRYLLVYDIREDRRLRRVHRVAKTFGESLQYSVFVCDMTDVERASLRRALQAEIKHDVDRVALLDLGPVTGRGVRCVDNMGTSRTIEPHRSQIW